MPIRLAAINASGDSKVMIADNPPSDVPFVQSIIAQPLLPRPGDEPVETEAVVKVDVKPEAILVPE